MTFWTILSTLTLISRIFFHKNIASSVRKQKYTYFPYSCRLFDDSAFKNQVNGLPLVKLNYPIYFTWDVCERHWPQFIYFFWCETKLIKRVRIFLWLRKNPWLFKVCRNLMTFPGFQISRFPGFQVVLPPWMHHWIKFIRRIDF